VCLYNAEEARKIAYQRRIRSGKMLKKNSKTAFFPLAMKSGFMYNSPVVCLGMKW
jgi:hypothetical protein